jgi:4-coumarate--CoA ligase
MRAMEPQETPSDLRCWTELIDDAEGDRFQWPEFTTPDELERPCMLFTTSGTSGLRKAAIYSHRNLVASFVAISHRSRHDTIAAMKTGRHACPRLNRVLHTISVSRAMGTTFPLAMILAAKARPTQVYLMSKTYVDMVPYLDIIQNLGINDVTVAPFTLARMFKEEGLTRRTDWHFPNLGIINVTGAPSSQRLLDRVRQFLLRHGAPDDVRIERSLGITEAASLISARRLCDPQNMLDHYQGRLEPNVQAKIMSASTDEENDDAVATEVLDGSPGEVWLRSPAFVSSYHNNAAATKAAFTVDGWFKTGDLGYLVEDKLFVVDRIKDILKTPDSIPPEYIESVLMEHPAVIDAAVVGVDVPEEGLQLARAFLVRRPGIEVSEAEMIHWMQREASGTAQLTGGVVFVERLPRNASGKLLRRVLRAKSGSVPS